MVDRDGARGKKNVDVRTRGFRSRRRTLLLAINRKRDANRR